MSFKLTKFTHWKEQMLTFQFLSNQKWEREKPFPCLRCLKIWPAETTSLNFRVQCKCVWVQLRGNLFWGSTFLPAFAAVPQRSQDGTCVWGTRRTSFDGITCPYSVISLTLSIHCNSTGIPASNSLQGSYPPLSYKDNWLSNIPNIFTETINNSVLFHFHYKGVKPTNKQNWTSSHLKRGKDSVSGF